MNIKIGDRLVVQQMPYPAYVERIEFDDKTSRTILHLDWGTFGKSRVFLHDENVIWYKYTSNN